jgi:hypothetical protein
VSRSFQADALMMLLFLASLLAVIRYFERPSLLRLLSAATLSGVTILYRPLVLFGILGAFSLATIHREGWKAAITDARFALFSCISLTPSFAYFGYGTRVGGYLGWKLQSSFQPHLLLHVEYWRGWRDLALDAVGPAFAGASMIGLAWLRNGLPRAIVTGLVLGYVAFGLAFTMHIHTHGYYHAQLIPIAAIAASIVAVRVAALLRGTGGSRYWWIPLAGVVMVTLHAAAGTVRDRLAAPVLFETPATARTIGEIVNHSTRVVYLSRYYGMPLQYHGEFTGMYWPRRLTYYLHPREGDVERSIQQRLDDLPFVPEYFVITAFQEFERHHADLREYLVRHCVAAAKTPEYLVYTACMPPRRTMNNGASPKGLAYVPPGGVRAT